MANVLGHYEVSKDIETVFRGMDRAGLNLHIRGMIICCGVLGVNVCRALIWIKANTLKESRLMI